MRCCEQASHSLIGELLRVEAQFRSLNTLPLHQRDSWSNGCSQPTSILEWGAISSSRGSP